MRAEKTENRKTILLINGKSETSLLVGLEQEGYEITVCESPRRPGVLFIQFGLMSSSFIFST